MKIKKGLNDNPPNTPNQDKINYQKGNTTNKLLFNNLLYFMGIITQCIADKILPRS